LPGFWCGAPLRIICHDLFPGKSDKPKAITNTCLVPAEGLLPNNGQHDSSACRLRASRLQPGLVFFDWKSSVSRHIQIPSEPICMNRDLASLLLFFYIGENNDESPRQIVRRPSA
jgi:hypothetical protein